MMVKLIREANRIIKLWRQFGPNESKIDLSTILNDIVIPTSNGDQCKVVFDQFDTFEGIMIRAEGTTHWTIGVNTTIKYQPRRNFTFAHEIGHFIAHRYKQNSFNCSVENLNDFQNEIFEREANEFAAHLLMPPDIVRVYDKERTFSHEAISNLATELGVSRAAAAYRWIELSERRIGFAISRDGFVCQGRASDALYNVGVFFRQGDEIPTNSLINQMSTPGEELVQVITPGVWHPLLPCHVSHYAATSGDFIYSYLDFDNLSI